MVDQEKFYDEEVAPELARLAKLCEDRGMGFVATVQYNDDGAGTTATLQEGTELSVRLAYVAARCNRNVDVLIGWIVRYALKHGHSSVYLTQLGVPISPEGERK